MIVFLKSCICQKNLNFVCVLSHAVTSILYPRSTFMIDEADMSGPIDKRWNKKKWDFTD